MEERWSTPSAPRPIPDLDIEHIHYATPEGGAVDPLPAPAKAQDRGPYHKLVHVFLDTCIHIAGSK
eukprot:6672337-Karenia_brevis.AAC.1